MIKFVYQNTYDELKNTTSLKIYSSMNTEESLTSAFKIVNQRLKEANLLLNASPDDILSFNFRPSTLALQNLFLFTW